MNEGIIALIGVLLSVSVSWVISARNIKIELEKHQSEIQKMYVDKLVEQRMKYYPIIYVQISELIKKIRAKIITKNELIKFQEDILNWDSNYSLYFSLGTGYRFHNFYMNLATYCQMTDEEFRDFLLNENELVNFRKSISELELALKTDLGIVPVDFAEIGKKFGTFEEYIEHSLPIERERIK